MRDKFVRRVRRLLGQTLTPAEFQDCVVDEIKRRQPALTVVRMSVDELRLIFPDQADGFMHLERAYAMYRATPGNLPGLLAKVISSLEPVEIEAEEELVVLVRPFDFEDGAYDADRLRRRIVGDLAAHVALDKPQHYVFPPASALCEDLKLDEEALWDRARRNTRERLGVEPAPLVPEQIMLIETDDGFAASLLAFDDFWDSDDLAGHGPLAVAAPSHMELHIAPLSDGESVERLRKVLAEADGAFFLTRDLLVRRNGRWEVLLI